MAAVAYLGLLNALAMIGRIEEVLPVNVKSKNFYQQSYILLEGLSY